MKRFVDKYFVLILVIPVLIYIGIVIYNAKQVEQNKWNQFLECSQDEGDWGCDSCYNAVFGEWPTGPYTADYE